MPYQRISVEEAESLIEKNEVTLIDIRDNENVEDVLSSADKNKPLIIYCYHGNSSQGAADYFYNMGFKQSFSVDGGFEEWKLKLINASI